MPVLSEELQNILRMSDSTWGSVWIHVKWYTLEFKKSKFKSMLVVFELMVAMQMEGDNKNSKESCHSSRDQEIT